MFLDKEIWKFCHLEAEKIYFEVCKSHMKIDKNNTMFPDLKFFKLTHKLRTLFSQLLIGQNSKHLITQQVLLWEPVPLQHALHKSNFKSSISV